MMGDKEFAVPIIVLFTKYEDFREKVEIDMEDEDLKGVTLEDECKKRFEMYYMNRIGGDYVVLEGVQFALISDLSELQQNRNG